ncbi:MAG: CoA-binding protein [Elusimicrobia bacterium]|nr:CoA-binding protein [Elusimicrobiota bacterium]
MSEKEPFCEVPAFNASSEEMAGILKTAKTIAVVGLSPKPERPSHDVARYLKARGYKIIPVNPGHKEILGEPCYPSLLEVPEKVDLVDIFRETAAVPDIVDQAIKIKAKAVWMQLGIIHNEAAKKAKAAGLKVVMNACTKVEHMGLGS